jgi:hypothetical protein
MKQMSYGGLAAALLFGTAVFAQTPYPRTQTGGQARQATTDEHVTVVGCVQREEDYRRAHNLSRGGVVGTGIGEDDEFVLVNATMAGRPPGTAGRAVTETEFELSGPGEEKLTQYVGKRVDISGNLERVEVDASGRRPVAPPRDAHRRAWMSRATI